MDYMICRQGTRRSSPRSLPQPWVEAAMGYDKLWFLDCMVAIRPPIQRFAGDAWDAGLMWTGCSVIEQNWSHSRIAEPHLGVVFHVFTADQLPIPRVALYAAAAKTIRVDIHVKGLIQTEAVGRCGKCRSEWSDLKSEHVVLPMGGFNPWCVQTQRNSCSSLNYLT